MERKGHHVDYDQVAPAYNGRFRRDDKKGVAAAVQDLATKMGAERALEAGCGTGHWLTKLQPVVPFVYGLDLSLGMLRQAQHRAGPWPLVCGRASNLPFPDACFDLILCINAFHHFDRPLCFLLESCRVLRPGGALAVVSMDPHSGRDTWYIYDYFEGTRECDLERFPSGGMLLDGMIQAGFTRATWQPVEHIVDNHVGRAAFESHFLQKHGSSQLTLLSDEAYAAGIAKMEAAIAAAEAAGEQAVFPADIMLNMVVGYR
jgi:SAM-dependent methyltransferase